MEKASGTRELLLETAQRLFFSRGFHQVGTLEICAEAGINKGTFYHFFPSKMALALAALDDYGAGTKAAMEGIVSRKLSATTKLKRILTLPSKGHGDWGGQEGRFWGCFVGNLALELSTAEPLIQERIQSILKEWEGCLQKVVRDLVREGAIPKIPPKKGAEALLSYLEGMTLLAKAQNDLGVFRRLAPGGLALLEGFASKARP